MRIIIYLLLIFLTFPVESYAQKTRGTRPKAQTSKTVQPSKSKKGVKSSGAKKKTSKAPVRKETAAEAQKRERETQQEIARTKKQIQENEAQVKKNLNELGRIQSDIIVGERIVSKTTAEVSGLDKKIASLESEISSNEAQLDKMRAEYLKSLKKIRARKNSSSDIAFIFGANSFKQALQRMRYLRQISAWRKKRSEEISQKVEALSRDKEALAKNRELMGQTLQKQLSAQQTLQTKYARQDAVVSNLKKNGKALQSHLSKKQAEANALKGRIAALIAEENRKAEAARKAEEARKAKAEEAKRAAEEKKAKENLAQTGKSEGETSKKDFAEARKRKPRSESVKSKDVTTNKEDVASSNNNRQGESTSARVQKQGAAASGFAGMQGALPRPVSGSFRITSPFGKHALPDLPDVVYDNPGIDAETAAGAKAQAVYGGKVSGVYMIPGFSTVVIVNHGSYYTVYGNIASSSVRVGDQVKQGDALGALAADEDNPGHTSIHFEVWHNRDKLNPESWIR